MIRKFKTEDAHETAMVWLRSGLAEYSYLPGFQKLNEAKVPEVFRKAIQAHCEIWVYESAGKISGFLAMKDTLVDRLYVDPAHQRQGIGTALLTHARKISPDSLRLRTHQQNHGARSFYEHLDFVAVKFGISPAPESAPDVEYHWGNVGLPATKGSCLCSKVHYEITGPLFNADHCHCSMCRRHHGAAFATYADFNPNDFKWISGEALVKNYEAPSGAGWAFCSECGSSLAGTDNGKVTSIALGTVDGDPEIRPAAHIFVGSKAQWYAISDDLPQCDERSV